LIILNPSTLTFLLDRLFSNLFKMIKVGTIIRTKNVIIASFHSPSERRRRGKIDISPGAQISAFLGLGRQWPSPVDLEADLGFRHD
jgi:hypothetical protein